MKKFLKRAPLIEKVATGVLFLSLLSYVTFLLLSQKYPQCFIFNLLKIAFSASLVGAIADTYAVFGLFHNLGPHTDILRKRRKELTEKTVKLVGEFLLSKDELLKELSHLNIEKIIENLDEEKQKETLKKVLIQLVEKRLENKNSGIFSTLLSFINIPLNQFINKEISNLVDKLFEEVRKNQELKEHIENHIKETLANFLKDNHEKIKDFIRRRLAQLSDEEFIQALKSASWKELQWIRINGALLGFIVGLILGILENVF